MIAPRVHRALRWLLPPVLAAGAAGLHFWLNVPNTPLLWLDPARRPRDRAARRRPAAAAEARPVAPEASSAADGGARETVLRRIFARVRDSTFEGSPDAPSVTMTEPRCKGQRCSFVLRGLYPHELELLAGALRDLKSDGASPWRRFHARVSTAGGSDAAARMRVTVVVGSDAALRAAAAR